MFVIGGVKPIKELFAVNMIRIPVVFVVPILMMFLSASQAALASEEMENESSIRSKVMKSLNVLKSFKGVASYYADKLQGHRTASGAPYNRDGFTCAHRSLPFGTHLVVTNPETGSQVEVEVTDRGPFHAKRIIDLSKAAARKLGIVGLAHVVCQVKRPRAISVMPNSSLAQ